MVPYPCLVSPAYHLAPLAPSGTLIWPLDLCLAPDLHNHLAPLPSGPTLWPPSGPNSCLALPTDPPSGHYSCLTSLAPIWPYPWPLILPYSSLFPTQPLIWALHSSCPTPGPFIWPLVPSSHPSCPHLYLLLCVLLPGPSWLFIHTSIRPSVSSGYPQPPSGPCSHMAPLPYPSSHLASTPVCPPWSPIRPQLHQHPPPSPMWPCSYIFGPNPRVHFTGWSHLACSPPYENHIFLVAWKKFQNNCEETLFPSIRFSTSHQ